MKFTYLILLLFIISSCQKNTLECEDLLQRYVEKNQKIKFISCEKRNGQTILEAKYKVTGENFEEIEKILVEKYGIGKLKFTCCGWESKNGKNGYIENEELKKINQNYVLEISMYANAEKENDKGEIYIELDKKNIDFYVIVKLLDI